MTSSHTNRMQAARCAAIFTALVALLAACAPRPSAATQPRDPVRWAATYAGPDRLLRIETNARDEGVVTWYTSLGLPNAEPIARAFEDKYRFLRVDVVRADGPSILTRIMEEARAGQPAADVVETPVNSLKPLKEKGLLVEYFVPSAGTLPADAKLAGTGPNIYWAVDRENYIGFAYNRNLVDPGVLPRDLDGVLAPGLKGLMQIVGTQTGIECVGAMLTNKSADFVRQLGQQDLKIQMVSGSAMLDLIARGEVAASPAVYQAEVKIQQSNGAPVEWIALEPVTANAGGIAFLAGAPHPNAAALFVQFMLGEEGQTLFREMGFGSAGVDPGFRRWYPGLGTTAAQFDDLYQSWKRTLDEVILRGT